MENLLGKIRDLNTMVRNGQYMEAFEKYYHPEVTMIENGGPPSVGKDVNREREQAFLEAVTEFREAKPLNVTVGYGVTMVEWHYDFAHREWGERNYQQVSVQQWQDGLIINERFYYNA